MFMDLLNTACDHTWSSDDIDDAGERIWTLERLFTEKYEYVDHELFDRARVSAPRLRPMRHQVAGVTQRLAFLVVGKRSVLGREPSHLGSNRFGLSPTR